MRDPGHRPGRRRRQRLGRPFGVTTPTCLPAGRAAPRIRRRGAGDRHDAARTAGRSRVGRGRARRPGRTESPWRSRRRRTTSPNTSSRSSRCGWRERSDRRPRSACSAVRRRWKARPSRRERLVDRRRGADVEDGFLDGSPPGPMQLVDETVDVAAPADSRAPIGVATRRSWPTSRVDRTGVAPRRCRGRTPAAWSDHGGVIDARAVPPTLRASTSRRAPGPVR